MTQTAELQPWPRRPARLAVAVIEELVDRVVSGAFPAGSTLPTEHALCEAFGVSRSVVREAIKSLETMGLVRVQQGQGTTARPLSDWELLNPTVLSAVVRRDAELSILDDLVDVRRALESQMAAQAAAKADAEERGLVTARMRELHEAIDDAERYGRADVAFHDAILAASGNRLGRAIIHVLTEQAYRSLRYIGEPTIEERRLSNVAHEEIHDAVVLGDEQRAATLMDDHILGAWLRRHPPRRGDADEDNRN